jgi:hypothetical protein
MVNLRWEIFSHVKQMETHNLHKKIIAKAFFFQYKLKLSKCLCLQQFHSQFNLYMVITNHVSDYINLLVRK